MARKQGQETNESTGTQLPLLINRQHAPGHGFCLGQLMLSRTTLPSSLRNGMRTSWFLSGSMDKTTLSGEKNSWPYGHVVIPYHLHWENGCFPIYLWVEPFEPCSDPSLQKPERGHSAPCRIRSVAIHSTTASFWPSVRQDMLLRKIQSWTTTLKWMGAVDAWIRSAFIHTTFPSIKFKHEA